MGGVMSSIFGAGQQSMPEMPEQTPAPLPENEKEPVAAQVRDTERRRILARRAMGGTLLTGSNMGGLLGRTGQRQD